MPVYVHVQIELGWTDGCLKTDVNPNRRGQLFHTVVSPSGYTATAAHVALAFFQWHTQEHNNT